SLQVAALWYIVFLLCLWDVESIVLIVPPAGETLALRIFNLLHYGHNTQVNALCLVLLLLALAPLLLWRTGKWIMDWKRGGSAAMITMIFAALMLAGCSQNNSRDQAIDSKFFSRAQVI